MYNFKVILIFAACLSFSYCSWESYCEICEKHTMCKYQGLGPACTEPGKFGVSENEKKLIVDVHNWVRRVVATGGESKGLAGGQYKAANLMKMVYDDDLAVTAQLWADQCLFQHDDCRDDARWKVGQNVRITWESPVVKEANWTETILSWYNEVNKFNSATVKAYEFDPYTAHYTQLLWHSTYAVGCGKRIFGGSTLYVCNYGPRGNWIGDRMYRIGEPCSKCPPGTYCDEALCAFIPENQPLNARSAAIKNDTVKTDKNESAEIKKNTTVEELKLKTGDFDYVDLASFTEQEDITPETNRLVTTNYIDPETKEEIEEIKKSIEMFLLRKLRSESCELRK